VGLPAPTVVTASPASVCPAATSNLSATYTDASINWYVDSVGGIALGSSTSGADFAVNPLTTTTYYAEANTDVPAGSVTFNYTGASQAFTVPLGVTSINIDAYGAQGGDAVGFASGWSSGSVSRAGGNGGRLQATLTVTPGQVLNLYVGGQGTTTTGGFNGGGAPASCSGTDVIWAGGGGASDIRIGGTALTDRVVVAGGGGGSAGAASSYYGTGGAGGGLTGANGSNSGGSCLNGLGGTASAGGTGGNQSCWCGC
jgi:hypothetical protein